MERSSNVLQRIQEGLGDKMEVKFLKILFSIRKLCFNNSELHYFKKCAVGFNDSKTDPKIKQKALLKSSEKKVRLLVFCPC